MPGCIIGWLTCFRSLFWQGFAIFGTTGIAADIRLRRRPSIYARDRRSDHQDAAATAEEQLAKMVAAIRHESFYETGT